MLDMLQTALDYIKHDDNRKLLSWIGGILVAVVTAYWAIFKYRKGKSTSNQPGTGVSHSTGVANGNVMGPDGTLIAAGPDAIINTGVANSNVMGPGGTVIAPCPGATVNMSAPFPPELLATLVKVVATSPTDVLTRHLADTDRKLLELSKQLGVHQNAVAGMLRILGEKDVPLELLPSRLDEIAGRYKDLSEQLQTLQSDDPEVGRLRAEARHALENGDYDQADALLSQAQRIDTTALDAQQKSLDARRLSVAQTLAARGALEEGRLNYRQAAGHYAKASTTVPPNSREQWGYLLKQADTLARQGEEFGDNQALQDAIDLYQKALPLRSRGKYPLDWAGTQNNLGNTLARLGERQSDSKHLEEAVTAFRAALEEQPRDRVPLDWAMGAVK